jgi:hypothetical protein
MIFPDTANIVITASNFNPSIITKDWLYQNNILAEPLTNFINTPVFSNSETNEFQMIVAEDRLQLTLKQVTQASMRVALGKLTKIVDLLPETPYKAVGYNFGYRFSKDECNIEFLFSPNRDHIAKLMSKEYELGANILFPFEGFIVTFSVSPMARERRDREVRFNYHSNVRSSTEIKTRLDKQQEVLEKTTSVVEALCHK